MATYSVTINEKSSTGKSLLNLLKSLDGIVTITPEKTQSARLSRSEFLDDLKQSIHEAKTNQTKPLKNLINAK
jgi:hypothetical protein